MKATAIPPSDVRDYAKSRGWFMVREAIKDRLYVLNHPTHHRQIVLPMDKDVPDYEDAVRLSLEKLAETESVSVVKIQDRIFSQRSDVILLRIGMEQEKDSLPLSFASIMLNKAEQFLRIAACVVVRPQPYFPRLTRSEAGLLVEAANFGHTAPGSFVMKISCPVNALDDGQIDNGQTVMWPFVRKATLALRNAFFQIVESIEMDCIDGLADRIKQEDTPLISSNLCDTIIDCYDEKIDNFLELSIDWASSLTIGVPADSRPIKIQPEYFPRIAELGRELRPNESYKEDPEPDSAGCSASIQSAVRSDLEILR